VVLDGEAAFTGPRLTSQLQLQADRPTLFLDEYDHILKDVNCDQSKMAITFRDTETYSKARRECESLTGGLVVSSHYTCSPEGSHSVFE